MTPIIKEISEKKLTGKSLHMSFENFRIAELWGSFMPFRSKISHKCSEDLISLAIYQPLHFENFKPSNAFEKWAAVEVSSFENIPSEMQTFVLPAGLYAVFNYIGRNTDLSIFEYIYQKWLTNSEYLLDDRPHFEVLGEKYKNNDPNSEEEIWIPIKLK